MAIKEIFTFEPTFVVPPGETLLETIEAKGISQAELARRTGRPLKTINGIIKGKVAITPDTALQFDKVLGVPARFWNNLERNYQEALAKQREEERLEKEVKCLDQFPIKQMIKLGWIEHHKEPIEILDSLYKYFGVASIVSWENIWEESLAFRQSTAFTIDQGAISAWVRKAELEALNMDTAEFNKDLFKESINKIREFTLENDPHIFVPELQKLCAKCGVAVVFIPELPGCRVSGVTKWLSRGNPFIGLSMRYKSNDHLWFTLFHEVGHILLHGKKLTFIEGIENRELEKKEEEANQFAENILIPKDKYEEFIARNSINRSNVQQFAEEINIAPGIIVGRLQKDRIIPYSHLNDLKQFYKWN